MTGLVRDHWPRNRRSSDSNSATWISAASLATRSASARSSAASLATRAVSARSSAASLASRSASLSACSSSGVGRNRPVLGSRSRSSPRSQHRSKSNTELCPHTRPSGSRVIRAGVYSASVSTSPARAVVVIASVAVIEPPVFLDAVSGVACSLYRVVPASRAPGGRPPARSREVCPPR